nr:sigma-E processing peptidase SpoIIGA [uncultured Sellimonas sp.]
MYYEIYIDVLFLVNFMMDYLLLLAVKSMLSLQVCRHRILAGAALGAFLTCIVVVLPIPSMCKIACFYMGISSLMILAALPLHTKREFVKTFFMLYVGGFLLGGIFSFFRQYIRIGSLYFLFAVISYELLEVVWKFIRRTQKLDQYTCEAEIEMAGQKVRLHGLIDTGNGLSDPKTGKPVCVVEKEAVKELLDHGAAGRLRYMGYRSVGSRDKMLPLVKFDGLHLYGKSEKHIKDAWIGISDTKISAGGIYEIIINPEIF